MSLLGNFLSWVTGFVARIFLERYKQPILEIDSNTVDNIPIHDDEYCTYRVRVHNREKKLFRVAAENCKGLLSLKNRDYELCWVGDEPSITINPGDHRELEICCDRKLPNREGYYPYILIPTKRGFFPNGGISNLRIENFKVSDTISGELRVTASNAGMVRKKVKIRRTQDGLRVTLHPI